MNAPSPAACITDQAEAIAAEAVSRELAANPEWERKYGDQARVKGVKDALYHLRYLATAVDADSPDLFRSYVDWARAMLEARHIPPALFATHLGFLKQVLTERLEADVALSAGNIVDAGIRSLEAPAGQIPGFIDKTSPLADLARQYLKLLLEGNRQLAGRLIADSLESGVAIKEVYLHVFAPAQREIGRLWQLNEISVAQEHYASAATQLIMSQVYSYVFSGDRNGRTLVATCVANELHEIGLRMVADFFEMAGWDTYYLGASAPIPDIVSSLVDRRADLLAISATMTPHVTEVRQLIAAIRADARCRDVRILVGGYPFNVAPELGPQVGADGCATDAAQAVELGNQLLPST